MKFFKILLPLLLCIAWYKILNKSLNIKNNSIPPLGKFFSPSIGFWHNAWRDDRYSNQEISQSGYKGNIVIDDNNVPHIFADDTRNAYFLQGYIHAKNRLWQMDFSTRAAEGRISEIVGGRALEFDKVKRRKGFAESARNSVEVWKKFPESFALVEAYCAGVNHYIQSLEYADYPIEYKLMDFRPEAWTPYKTALFHKNMADVLCGRDHDIELTEAKKYFDADFNILFPENSNILDPVIPRGTKWNFNNVRKDSITATNPTGFIERDRENRIDGIGSNNWAVNKLKTVNKNPILCNDPHLSLTLPSIWFEQQIITPNSHVYGVTFPGIPGVVIGFNEHIAWGVTNAGWDVMDWYAIQWQDKSKKAYQYDGQWIPTEYRIEKIKIKGGTEISDTVKLTKWGPIVYDDTHPRKDLAMHWIINDPSTSCEMDVFTDLNKSKNVNEYRSALSKFPYPAQNFAFASDNGDIALTVQGNMPIKSDQQGRFIQDGSSSANAWHGLLTAQNNPFVLNPYRNFISSANQKSTDGTFPNYFNDGDFRDYRANVINELLSKNNDWTIDKMKEMQFNNFSMKAKTAIDAMLKLVDTSTIKNSPHYTLYQSLQNWNCNYDSTSREALVFDVWFDALYKNTWDELLQDTMKKNIKLPSDQSTIELLKNNPRFRFFDIQSTPIKETAVDIVNIAFDSTAKYLLTHPLIKNWSDKKNASISHLARIDGFSVKNLVSSGAADVINAHGSTFGPSWRMIVELTDQGPIAYAIYPGGQSGAPGSKYYSNMIELWRTGRYRKLNFTNSKDSIQSRISQITFN